MHNKKIKITIIVGIIYLVLLLSVDVIKVLNNKPLRINNETTNESIREELSSVSPKVDEETTEVTESTTEEATVGELPQEEGTTLGTTKQQNSTNNTTRKTTTTTKAIPSKISCSNREIISLSREEMLANIGHPYNSNTCLKWNSFRKGSKDTFDGTIPTEWLSDSIFVSMATPAESLSNYMISAWRDNAHDLGITKDNFKLKMIAIGALYRTKDIILPDTFTINYGKIKLFGYSKSKKKWVVLDSNQHPVNVMQYQLPWTANLPVTDYTKKFVDHGDYVSIDYSSSEEIDETRIMHFWGKLADYDKSDIIYFASAYEVWTSTPAAVGGLTATSGIDTKDNATGVTTQLYSSYGMKVTTKRKVLWGHTIPMSEYDYYRDGVELQKLFNSN